MYSREEAYYPIRLSCFKWTVNLMRQFLKSQNKIPPIVTTIRILFKFRVFVLIYFCRSMFTIWQQHTVVHLLQEKERPETRWVLHHQPCCQWLGPDSVPLPHGDNFKFLPQVQNLASTPSQSLIFELCLCFELSSFSRPLPSHTGGCMGKQCAPYTHFVACCLASAVWPL